MKMINTFDMCKIFALLYVFCMCNVLEINAIGDEDSYLMVDSAKTKCTFADFGQRLPEHGVQGQMGYISTDEHCNLLKNSSLFLKPIVFLVLKGNNEGIVRCDPYHVLMRLSGFNMFNAIKTVIVVNWMNNEYQDFVLRAPEMNSRDPDFSICMVSKSVGRNLVRKVLYSDGKLEGSLHDGATEIVSFEFYDAQGVVTVDESNIALENKAVIPDNYRKIYVEASKVAGYPSFQVRVTDQFHSSNNWYCKSGGMPEKARREDYFPTQHNKDGIWSKAKEDVDRGGHFIWLDGETSNNQIACIGVRVDMEIAKYGYRYSLQTVKRNFEGSVDICSTIRKHLVTIHSKQENRYVASLTTSLENDPGVFIGLNDRETEGHFQWPDGSLVDYYNWADGHPLKNGDDYDCVSIHTDGTWRNIRCEMRLATICQVFTGGMGDDTSEEHGQCLIRIGGRNETSLLAQNPRPLHDIADNLCMFGHNHLSCCTERFVDENVRSAYKNLVRHSPNSKCKKVLQQLVCFPCMGTQGHYATLERSSNRIHGVKMNICEDTCITIWETCTVEELFGSNHDATVPPDAKVFCETFMGAKLMDTPLGQIKIGVRDSSATDCFRIDGLAPGIKLLSPQHKSSVTVRDKFRVQFDEEIRLIGGSVTLIKKPETDGEETLKFSTHLLGPHVTTTTTTWHSDTVEFNFAQFAHTCIPDGDYYVSLPSYGVVDMAGNAYAGNSAAAWEVSIQKGCLSGPGFFVWTLWILLFCGLFYALVYAAKSRGYDVSSILGVFSCIASCWHGCMHYIRRSTHANSRGVYQMSSDAGSGEESLTRQHASQNDTEYTMLDEREMEAVHGELHAPSMQVPARSENYQPIDIA